MNRLTQLWHPGFTLRQVPHATPSHGPQQAPNTGAIGVRSATSSSKIGPRTARTPACGSMPRVPKTAPKPTRRRRSRRARCRRPRAASTRRARAGARARRFAAGSASRPARRPSRASAPVPTRTSFDQARQPGAVASMRSAFGSAGTHRRARSRPPADRRRRRVPSATTARCSTRPPPASSASAALDGERTAPRGRRRRRFEDEARPGAAVHPLRRARRAAGASPTEVV